MTKDEFLKHIYKNVWIYIIEKKEFSNYFYYNEAPEYYPDEFAADSIPNLINRLKENCPFYDTYKQVISSIGLDKRQLIIDFINWFRIFESKSSIEILNEFDDSTFDTRGLDKLTEYIEKRIVMKKSKIDNKQNDKLSLIYNVIEKFTSATKSLQNRRKNKPIIELSDEYDMQDILYTILKPHFPTINIEEVVPGNDFARFLKIDFVITSIKVAIECKFIRNNSHAKTISKELNDDIQTYHKNIDCNHLIFFVYDKELLIKNPDLLEKSYSKKQIFDGKEMQITLKIRPQN